MENSIEGTITQIVHQNSADGFCVAILEEECTKETFKIVGAIPNICLGDLLKVSGNWTSHSVFGDQLNVESYEYVKPKTLEGITNYLSSGFVRGVGPVTAEKIVSQFGDKTLSVLDETPNLLLKIDGIGKKKIQLIIEDWQTHKEIQEIMVFLQGHDISANLAAKIHKQYGEHTIEKVKENPYRLATDLWGIGFKRSDQIAKSLGIPQDAPQRIQAGVVYTLDQFSSNGHVMIPRDLLMRKAAELLGVSAEHVDSSIAALLLKATCIEDQLKLENGKTQSVIYAAQMYSDEVGIAENVERLLIDQNSCLQDIAELGQEVLAEIGDELELTKDQWTAINHAIHAKISILSGGPGTGKSFCLKTLVDICDAQRKTVLLASPTGRASKRLSEATGREAVTVHRLLGVMQGDMGIAFDSDTPLEADLIVIDETSMLDTHMTCLLLNAVQSNTHILFVGDPDQLPSVGSGNILFDFIHSGVIPVTKLDKIFRQAKNSKIIINAHKINQGIMPDLENEKGGDFYFFNKEDAERLVESVVDMICNKIPAHFGFDAVMDVQVLAPMHKGTAGIYELNRRLREALNPPNPSKREMRVGERTYRMGDKVMQLKNSYDKGVFNGDMGVITQINSEENTLVVDFDGDWVNYESTEMDQITHSYCVSIHKSQGSEFPVSVVVLHNTHYMMLQRNLVYTAITRAKELAIVIGSRKAFYTAVKNNRSVRRYTGLQERLKRAALAAK